MMKKAIFMVAAILAVFVLVGCKDADSDSGSDSTPQPFTIKVVNLTIPTAGQVFGASLMEASNPTTPVAIGIPTDGMGTATTTFSFYHPASSGSLPYDADKPFNTDGQYMLGLALTSMAAPNSPVAIYTYMKNSNPVITFDSDNSNYDLNLTTDFMSLPQM